MQLIGGRPHRGDYGAGADPEIGMAAISRRPHRRLRPAMRRSGGVARMRITGKSPSQRAASVALTCIVIVRASIRGRLRPSAYGLNLGAIRRRFQYA